MTFKIARTLTLIAMLGTLLYAKDAPKTLPSISLANLEGKTVSSSEWAGKVVVIDFWATWCVACRDAFPVLNEMKAKYGDKVVVVGISNESAGASKIVKFVKKMSIQYLVLQDPEDSQSKVFGFESVPSLYVYGTDGKLLGSYVGLEDANKKALEALVAKSVK